MEKTKYGIISDIRENPEVVPRALQTLVNLGVQKLVLNGNIGYGINDIAFVLDSAVKFGLETYVQHGSHEKLDEYFIVINHFSAKYPNIVDVSLQRKIDNENHHLVFLPGSDLDHQGKSFDIRNLESFVSDPEKTVVFCHLPRKFDEIKKGIDVCEFGEALFEFKYRGDLLEKGTVFSIEVAREMVSAGYPVRIKQKNMGDHKLRSVYEKVGVTKAVSGNFQRAAHRAVDSQGNYVREESPVNELFWNASCIDANKVGILTVDGTNVMYKNVKLNKIAKREVENYGLRLKTA